MRSTNPVLSRDEVFTRGGYATFRSADEAATQMGTQVGEVAAPPGVRPMTLDDVITRTAMLFGVALVTAGVAWVLELGLGIAIVAMLVGLGLVIVNAVKKTVSPPLILAYAAVEGVFLGAFSQVISTFHNGVVTQAILGTIGAFAAMLVLYRTGVIRVTARFRKVLVGALLGYLGFLLINLVLYGVFNSGTSLWDANPLAFLTAGFAVVLASLFLTLDFDEIERGIKVGAPEPESWRAAFGLMVTLIWLYIEMLRLLSILNQE
jgi:uncharacterized YccA/Bax inhibitor family protein